MRILYISVMNVGVYQHKHVITISNNLLLLYQWKMRMIHFMLMAKKLSF